MLVNIGDSEKQPSYGETCLDGFEQVDLVGKLVGIVQGMVTNMQKF